MFTRLLRHAASLAKSFATRIWRTAKRVANRVADATRSLWAKHRRKMASDSAYAANVRNAARVGGQAVNAVIKGAWGTAAAAVVAAVAALAFAPVLAS